jgi:hypothetical protein
MTGQTVEILIYSTLFGIAPAALAVLLSGVVLKRGIELPRLLRVDLVAMFVATAGIATILGIARTMVDEGHGVVGFTQLFLLPFVIPLAWLARYALEDAWGKSIARRRLEKSNPDMRFLTDSKTESKQAMRPRKKNGPSSGGELGP